MGPEGGLGQWGLTKLNFCESFYPFIFFQTHYKNGHWPRTDWSWCRLPTTSSSSRLQKLFVVFHWPTKGSKKNNINFSCWKDHIFIFLIVPCMIGQYCWLDFLFCYFILGLWSLALLLIRYIPTTYDIFIIWFEASSSGCSSSFVMILLCYLWKAL